MELTRLLCPWYFPGKNTGVGYHSLLKGISWNRDWTWVSCIAGRLLTIWVILSNCNHIDFVSMALHYNTLNMTAREGNGNPLQYSCLENPVDRGAWCIAVHGVTQSRTQLKWLSSSSNITAPITRILAVILGAFYLWAFRKQDSKDCGSMWLMALVNHSGSHLIWGQSWLWQFSKHLWLIAVSKESGLYRMGVASSRRDRRKLLASVLVSVVMIVGWPIWIDNMIPIFPNLACVVRLPVMCMWYGLQTDLVNSSM